MMNGMFQVVLLLLLLAQQSSAWVCLKSPPCFCSTTNSKAWRVSCQNVTDLKPVQDFLLSKKVYLYSLRVHSSPGLVTLPSKVLEGTSMIVLGVESPLSDVAEDALDGIRGLKIVNIQDARFVDVPAALASGTMETVQLEGGRVAELRRQLQNCTALTRALLAGNEIVRVDPEAFSNVSSLVHLDLSRNRIVELDPRLFLPLNGLESLDLSRNYLHTVDGYFDRLNPQVLRLYGNNLTSIDQVFTRKKWNLKYLDIGGMSDLLVTSSTFNGSIPNLLTLSLNSNGFQTLDHDLLRNFRRLITVYLNGNNLSDIPPDFFSYSNRLRTVELSHNNLTSMEVLFPANGRKSAGYKLTKANLSGNKISSITVGSSAKNVSTLNLSDNAIATLKSRDFENLTMVKRLDLSENLLRSVDTACFEGLAALEWLDLSSTGIASLNGSLQRSPAMRSLRVQSASLKTIDRNEFSGLKKLKELYLRGNELDSVFKVFGNLTGLRNLDLSENNLTTVTVNSLPVDETGNVTIKEIWMKGNPWVCDCRLSWILDWLKQKGNYLKDQPLCDSPLSLRNRTLRSLNQTDLWVGKEDCSRGCKCSCEYQDESSYSSVDCSNAGLVEVPDAFPANSREIYLQGNSISKLGGIMGSLPLMRLLDLEGNSLGDLDLSLLPRGLAVLKLARNNLTRFPVSQWNASRPGTVTLAGNPWRCDCAAWGFSEWLKEHKTQVEDAEDIKCADGELKNKVIVQLNREDLCSTLTDERIQIAVGTAAGFLSCLIIACCCFRRVLAVLLHSCGCSCLKKDERLGYSFDAFFIYAEEDGDVATAIADGIESATEQYKLFTPTTNIFLNLSADNVDSSLNECCKVIVLLTKDFLRNSHCVQLLKASMCCSIQKSSQRMIFITRRNEKVLKEVDAILRAVVKNSTVIEWGECLFWNKLKFHLPKKNTRQQMGFLTQN